jgi:hypothetical protein
MCNPETWNGKHKKPVYSKRKNINNFEGEFRQQIKGACRQQCHLGTITVSIKDASAFCRFAKFSLFFQHIVKSWILNLTSESFIIVKLVVGM